IARPMGKQQVIDDQEDDRARYGDHEAVEVQAGYSMHAERPEQPAADQRTNDAEKDIEKQPFARLVDDLAGDEARDQAQNNPRYDRHETSSCRLRYAAQWCCERWDMMTA